MRFTPETARIAGRLGGLSRRRDLTEERLRAVLGRLDTPGDAKRWLEHAYLWSATKAVSSGAGHAMVRAVGEWVKATEAEATFAEIERLRAIVRDLTA